MVFAREEGKSGSEIFVPQLPGTRLLSTAEAVSILEEMGQIPVPTAPARPVSTEVGATPRKPEEPGITG
jgi:hypothetical protein